MLLLLMGEGCCWTSFRFTTTTGKTATCSTTGDQHQEQEVPDTVDSTTQLNANQLAQYNCHRVFLLLVKAVAVGEGSGCWCRLLLLLVTIDSRSKARYIILKGTRTIIATSKHRQPVVY